MDAQHKVKQAVDALHKILDHASNLEGLEFHMRCIREIAVSAVVGITIPQDHELEYAGDATGFSR